MKRILIGCSVWACSYDVFDLGDYSSPDLPCGQKDWRKVKNEAEVHQARPNCHCQVNIHFHKKYQALNYQIK